MLRVLLGLALTASLTVPASADSLSSSGFRSLSAFGSGGSHGVRLPEAPMPGCRDGFNGRHSRHIHVGDGVASGYGGYYDGDYDANRSFDPDKWNDWWHDRPDRAYPAWMRRNQDCARVWYSGSELTC